MWLTVVILHKNITFNVMVVFVISHFTLFLQSNPEMQTIQQYCISTGGCSSFCFSVSDCMDGSNGADSGCGCVDGLGFVLLAWRADEDSEWTKRGAPWVYHFVHSLLPVRVLGQKLPLKEETVHSRLCLCSTFVTTSIPGFGLIEKRVLCMMST